MGGKKCSPVQWNLGGKIIAEDVPDHASERLELKLKVKYSVLVSTFEKGPLLS